MFGFKRQQTERERLEALITRVKAGTSQPANRSERRALVKGRIVWQDKQSFTHENS